MSATFTDFVSFLTFVLILLFHRSLVTFLYLKAGAVQKLGDASIHSVIVSHVKAGGWNRPIDRFVIPNRLSYPLGFHLFAANFPENLIARRPWLPNYIVYAVSSVVFSLIATWIVFAELSGLTLLGTLLTLALLVTFDLSQNWFHGPATTYLGLSSRLSGRLFTSLFFLSIWVSQSIEGMRGHGIALAIVFGAMAIASSTFAAQAILLPTTVLILFFQTVDLLLVVVGLIFLSAALTRGHSIRSLTGMMMYWRIYLVRVARSPFAAEGLSAFFSLPTVGASSRRNYWRRAAHDFFAKEPFRTISRNPIFFLAMFLSLRDGLSVLGAMFISICLIWLITSTTRFNFLGESYRYIEYSSLYLAPTAIARELYTNGLSVQVITLLGLSTALLLFTRHKASNTPQKVDTLGEFLHHLKLPSGSVVFPISMRLGGDICSKTDNVKSFWWQPGGITDLEMYDFYVGEYPLLSSNWQPLCELHEVTHVIADKSYEPLSNYYPGIEELPVILENEQYIAFGLDAATNLGQVGTAQDE